METKACTRCKIQKPLSQFHKRTKAKDGLQGWCKECNLETRKECYRKNPKRSRNYAKGRRATHLKWIYDYLKNHPCVDCGETDPVVLEFDHVRGKKTATISKLVAQGKAWLLLQEEINKCDVRCANCHRRRTAINQGWYKHIQV